MHKLCYVCTTNKIVLRLYNKIVLHLYNKIVYMYKKNKIVLYLYKYFFYICTKNCVKSVPKIAYHMYNNIAKSVQKMKYQRKRLSLLKSKLLIYEKEFL